MSTQVAYEPFGGGLDYVTSPLSIDVGKLSECLNFEEVFGKQGYKRVDGYERFDGRAEPHKAVYHVLPFKDGVNQVFVGDVVTGASATGVVVSVVLDSGDWGALDAAGKLIIDRVTGTFAANESILVGATPSATAASASYRGSVSEKFDVLYRVLATSARRSLIEKVPGEGPILGVAVYNGNVYAVRNAEGGNSATLWRSSANGWITIRAGLYPGGEYRFVAANFSGDATKVSLFGVNGRGRMFKWDDTAFTFAAPIFGSQATSTTSNAVEVGSKTFTLANSARSYTAGQPIVIWSTADAANRMFGTVTSYTSGTNALVVNVTDVVGSGTFTDWEMGLGDFTDKPFDVASHKDHLWLAYPRGQLQSSNLGNPMVFTTSAALFGLGDEITGIASLKGDVLGAFCRNSINILSGTSLTDWSRAVYSNSSGAMVGTLQEVSGNAIFLDERGLTTLQATQNYGDFELAIFSRNVAPVINQYRSSVVGSRMHRGKYQYRLYMKDGDVLSCTIRTPNPVIQPNDVSFARKRMLHKPVCFASGDMPDGQEGYFFGTDDGWVMREDVGTSFDGQAIDAVMKLHFNHFKSPANKKRFHKLVLEIEAGTTTEILFRQQFDFDDGVYPASLTQSALTFAGGGAWNAGDWDRFYWSLPRVSQAEANVTGIGRNMSLIFFNSSSTDEPFYVQGLLIHYTVMGMTR